MSINPTIVRDLSRKQSPAAQRVYFKLTEEKRKNKLLADKVLGRIGSNGQQKLEKLSIRHRLIIAMACEGTTSAEIARKMGCSSATVNRVINDPLGKVEINKYMEGVRSDLKRMLPLAIKVIKDNLDSGDQELRMKALDKFIKLNDFVDDKPTSVVNNTTIIDARVMFLSDLKTMAEKAGVMELEVEDVQPSS